MKLITCKRASELGLSHYFTGKPCKNGHIAPRHVTNRTCMECAKKDASLNYWCMTDEHREAYLSSAREYNQQNMDLFRAYAKRTHAQDERELLHGPNENKSWNSINGARKVIMWIISFRYKERQCRDFMC